MLLGTITAKVDLDSASFMRGMSAVQGSVNNLDGGQAFTSMDQKINQAAGSTKSLSDRMNGLADSIGKAGDKLTKFVTLPVAGFFTTWFMGAANLEQTLGATEIIFGDNAAAIIDWSEDSAQAFGMTQDQALSAVNNFNALFKQLDEGQDVVAGMSQEFVGLSADLSAMWGGSPELASQRLTSALRGNYEGLDQYNINLTEAMVSQEAMNIAMAEGRDVITEADKLQARYNLIMQQTTAAQGQFAREADTAAGSLATARAEYLEAAAALGEHLLPIGTRALQMFADWASRIANLSDTQQKWILGIMAGGAAIGPLLIGVSKVITATTTIVGASMKAAEGIKFLTGAIRGMNLALLANPVVLIIAAFVALGVALVVLYKKWEPFRNVVDRTAAALKKFAQNKIVPFLANIMKTIDRLSDAFDFYKSRTDLVSAALKSLAAVFPALRGVIDPIVNTIFRFTQAFESLRSYGINPVSAAFLALQSTFPAFSNTIGAALDVVNHFREAFTHVKDAFSDFMAGDYAAGFEALGSAVVSAFKGIVEQATLLPRLLTDVFRAIDWGAVGTTLWNGAVSAFNRIVDAVRSINWGAVGSALVDGLQSAVGWLIGVGQMLWDKGSELIGGLLGGIGEKWTTVKTWFGDNITKSTISSAIGAAGDWLEDKGRAILISLYNGVTEYWNETVKPWFSDLKGTVKGLVSAPYTWLLDTGKQIIQGLQAGMELIWSKVESWFQGKIDWISEKFDWISDKISRVGELLGISTGGEGEEPEGNWTDIPPELHPNGPPGGNLNIDTAASRLQLALLGESFSQLKALFDTNVPPIAAGFGAASTWSAAPLAALASIKGGFTTTLPALVAQSQVSFSAAKSAAVTNIDSMKASVSNSISSMSSDAAGRISEMKTSVSSRSAEMADNAINNTTRMNLLASIQAALMESRFKTAMMNMNTTAATQMSILSTIVRGGMSNAADAVAGMAGRFRAAGADAIQGLVNGAESRLGALEGVVSRAISIMSRIPSLGNSPWPMMIGAGEDALDGLVIGWTKRMPTLDTAIRDAIDLFGVSPSASYGNGYQPVYANPAASQISHVTYTTTVLTIPPDEWVELARKAENAPMRTAEIMKRARSLVPQGG